MGIHDIPKTELIERAAKELQKVETVQPPAWAIFVKTGAFKERQPARDDWWFVRAAAILRRLSASHGPIGVQKLRTLYGGKKNRGHKPERFYPGSGSILRKVLQQLEKAGLAKRVEKGLRKGRIITPQGLSLLGKVADQYMKEHNIVLPKTPEGELHMIELPKEKPAKKPRARKKPAVAEDAAQSDIPAPEAPSAPVAEKPKRVRAPRKSRESADSRELANASRRSTSKKVEAVTAVPETAPAPQPAPTEQKPAQ